MIDLGDYDNGNQSEESRSKSHNSKSDNDNKKKKLKNATHKEKVHYNEDEEVVSSSEELIDDEAEESEEEEEESHLSKEKPKEEKRKEEDEDADLEEDTFNDDEEDNDKELTRLDKLNELLFCVQGIGKYTDETKTKYEKHTYCEPSLRDIHRFLRKEDPEKPLCKRGLLNWNFCESDLLPLLFNYESDEKIHQLCLVILVDLTEPLPDVLEERQEISAKLSQLNKFLINSPLIELLSRALNDSSQKLNKAQMLKEELKKEERSNQLKNEEKMKVDSEVIPNDNNAEPSNDTIIEEADRRNRELEMRAMKKRIADIEIKNQNLIELIIVLLKQIIALYNTNDLSSSSLTYSVLFTKLVQNKLLDAIVYHSNNFEDKFTQKLGGTLLDIIYYLTRIFTPKCIFDLCSKQPGNNRPLTELQRLIQQEELEKKKRRELYSSRPNNFGTRIKVVRPIDKSSFVVSNVTQLLKNQKQFLSEKSNAFGNQLHKGRGRNAVLIKNKKIPQSQIAEEVQMINNVKLKTAFSTSVNLTQQSFSETLLHIKTFFETYIIHCLNGLVYFYYFLLGKEEQLEKYDKYNLISVMEFFIEFNRLREYARMKEEANDTVGNHPNKNRFNFAHIKECLTDDMINYCYNALYEQMIMKKKTERKVLIIFPIVNYLKQVLYASFDSYKYKTPSEEGSIEKESIDFNLSLNVLIQDTLLTKDFSKVIKELFVMFNEAYHPQELLYDLIEFTELYFGSLELFSNKRSLKIKKRKAHKKKAKDDDEEQLYEKMLHLNEDKDQSDDSSLSDIDDFIERDLDVNDEAKCLVDYEVIDKLFLLFRQENITSTSSFNLSKRLLDLKNSPKNIIKFITNLFDRIVNKVKYFWIFFQMDYLLIINNLLNDSLFREDIAFLATKNVLLKIVHEYFRTFKENKLLSIESLFHFNDASSAQMVLSNYEFDRADHIERDEDYVNEAVDMNREFAPEEGEAYYNPNKLSAKEKEWTKEEDLLLINNYFEYEHSDNLLQVLTNQLGARKEKDILHRLKKLKVRKGKDKAMKKYCKYHNIRIEAKHKEGSVANCIIQLAEKAKDDQFKAKMSSVIKIISEQIASTKNRKELLGKEVKYECVLIPMSNEEMEMYQDENFCDMLYLAGLSRKSDEKRFFYVGESLDAVDVEIIKDKIERFAQMINENAEEVNEEREEKRKKHKKKHHLHKSKKKGHFFEEFIVKDNDITEDNEKIAIDKPQEQEDNNVIHEEDKEVKPKEEEEHIEEEKFDQVNELDQEIGYSSNKKKKKLKKRLREEDINDIEME